MLWFASLNLGNLLINSALIMLYQKAVLSIIIPALKKCFGDDSRKIWSVVMPSIILALELSQCVLFLRSKFASDFLPLLIMQELNSVFKNTGQYNELYSFVRMQIGRPLAESARKLIDEKRQILAPCDNIGEIVSPLVLLVIICLESLFDVLPGVERAPFLAETGILGGWRMGEGLGRTRGEVPTMLSIVLVVRILFCWIELKVRQYQRRDHDSFAGGTADGSSSQPRPTAVTRSRRSSSVLYSRIAESREIPAHMRYLAVGLFCYQPVMLVFYAAWRHGED